MIVIGSDSSRATQSGSDRKGSAPRPGCDVTRAPTPAEPRLSAGMSVGVRDRGMMWPTGG